MLLAQFQFQLINIIDIIVVLLVLGFLIFALLWGKKGWLLAALYTLLFAVHITIVVLDALYSLPVAKSISTILMVFLVVALAVVYQSNLKIFYFKLSKTTERGADVASDVSDEELKKTVDEIIKACQTMLKTRTGALIVIAPSSVPSHVLETGVELGAKVSASLLEAIFNTRAPFHDGATIIKGDRALAAGCFLPLSQSQTVAKNLGTRHRAGIGITEETDMFTIIVSEETGIISVARRGELRRFVTPDRLRDMLHQTFKIAQPKSYRSL